MSGSYILLQAWVHRVSKVRGGGGVDSTTMPTCLSFPRPRFFLATTSVTISFSGQLPSLRWASASPSFALAAIDIAELISDGIFSALLCASVNLDKRPLDAVLQITSSILGRLERPSMATGRFCVLLYLPFLRRGRGRVGYTHGIRLS